MSDNLVDVLDPKKEYDVSIAPFGAIGFRGGLKNNEFEARFRGLFDPHRPREVDIHYRIIGMEDVPSELAAEIEGLIAEALILNWPRYGESGAKIAYLFRGAK